MTQPLPSAPDDRIERAAICIDGLIAEWLGGNRELVACTGCAGCEPHRYRAPDRAAADRAWITAAARGVQARRAAAAAPLRFRFDRKV